MERSIWAAARMSASRPIDAKFRPPALLRNWRANNSGASGSAPEEKGTAKAEIQSWQAVIAWALSW